MEYTDREMEIAYTTYTSALEELGFLVYWDTTIEAINQQKQKCRDLRAIWENLLNASK